MRRQRSAATHFSRPTRARRPPGTPSDAVDPHQAVDLARELLEASERRLTPRDRARAERISRIAAHPDDLEFMLTLTDQVARICDPQRSMQRLSDLLKGSGPPEALGPLDRFMLQMGVKTGVLAPGVVTALVRRRIRHETDAIVLDASEDAVVAHINMRHAQGIETNLNVLGESIAGRDEGDRRRRQILGYVALDPVEYISVKSSAIVPRLSQAGFDRSVDRVVDGLRPIFAAAVDQSPATFVNLDVEDYGDVGITQTAFRRLLLEPELFGLDAGIVVQAYLPDSHQVLDELGAWALDRRRRGGGRTKVRIVKGANLGMERVEAELHGWMPAPYPSKGDVDASYKLLVRRALDPRWGDALWVGIASHNLFDVAWAMLTAERINRSHQVEVEMLEGMAPGQPEAIRARGFPVRLYTPVVLAEEMPAAAGYLVRRLDENSADDNYLRHHLDLSRSADAWELERRRFVASVEHMASVSTTARRSQNRQADRSSVSSLEGHYRNSSDTDWAKPANRKWIAAHVTSSDPAMGRPRTGPRSVPDHAVIDRVMARAKSGQSDWAATSNQARADLLTSAAEALEAARGQLIATMVHEAGKVITEADIEVSEAVDFATHAARLALELEHFTCESTPVGTVLVVPPWNFPLAIPMGGTLYALAGGNTVVLKPAPETRATAEAAAECLWSAGISRDALQVVACPDGDVGRHLVTHPDADTVVLTGAWETARAFLEWKPTMSLLAETSGKNAIVVTAAADIDTAVADVVRSAFCHAGQKCSAASLVLADHTLLADGRFLSKLADATRTLIVGQATDPATEVGPLIAAPEGRLLRALTKLDRAERWLVQPHELGPRLWSPGIRTGVKPGSWFADTECFGPVLGVITVEDLHQAVEYQNSSAYGLTGGLQSLDPKEIAYWTDRVEVGNAYVNRAVTGAVVNRQPFGGWRRSSVGPTLKSGGPGALIPFRRWADGDQDGDRRAWPISDDRSHRLRRAEESYHRAWSEMVSDVELGFLDCESNLLRHRPLPDVVLLVAEGADPNEVEMCRRAAARVGCGVTEMRSSTLGAKGTDDAMEETFEEHRGARLRVLGHVGPDVLRLAHSAFMDVDLSRPVADGHIELRRWSREQSLSVTQHRYGRLSTRSM